MILFWLALVTLTVADGTEGVMVLARTDGFAECSRVIHSDAAHALMAAIKQGGDEPTGAFCDPVFERDREPMVGGAPT